MANMSHCRFQNTLADLRDCNNALGEMSDDPQEELEEAEFSAFVRLVKLCRQIAGDYEDVT